ncbi:pilus assembly protein TadG-related protein [Rossellomorea marisflavi]|uniref:pilus assembly protein TadG-related protein n=1 Tax=Rossellomorea marisflavi TaxID=189381 RepID=UPI003516D5AA
MRAEWFERARNEEGNSALFVIGLMGIMMILFVFVLNFAKVFAVKEEAMTTSQQASLAATAVFYEEMNRWIEEYEDEKGILEKLLDGKSIPEKIEEKKSDLAGKGKYRDYSDNELSIEALDLVMRDVLTKGDANPDLHNELAREIEYTMMPLMMSEARDTIIKNGGNTSGATIAVKNGQVYVRASNTMEGTSFKGFFTDLKEDLFQDAAGPKIDFWEDVRYLNIGERSLD